MIKVVFILEDCFYCFFLHCITHKLYLLSLCFSCFLYFMLIYLHTGYQKFVDPGISPEFQAAAVRLGITMAPPGVYMRYCSSFLLCILWRKSKLIQNPLCFVCFSWVWHCQCTAVITVRQCVYSIRNIMICIGSPPSYRNRTCHFREIINKDGSSSPAMRLCNSFWKRQVYNICVAAFS